MIVTEGDRWPKSKLKMIRRICPEIVIFSCIIPPNRDDRANGRGGGYREFLELKLWHFWAHAGSPREHIGTVMGILGSK